MSKQAKNFNDVCRIFRDWGYSLRYDYKDRFTKKTVLVFELDYGLKHPVNMQYFIGHLYKVTSSKNKLYTVSRV